MRAASGGGSFNGDRRRLELAYSLMFTLPGTPVIRYGDELGIGDNLDLPERVCARTPMQWSTEPHAGFTRSDKPVVPVIEGGPYGYRHVNAAAQRRDPNSMLNWMERIIRMHNSRAGQDGKHRLLIEAYGYRCSVWAAWTIS
jgi:maltose alpha-D-glucosyltransferase/alpha-amylase